MTFDLQLFKAARGPLSSGLKPFRPLSVPGPLPPPSFKRKNWCTQCGLFITTPHEIAQTLCDECFAERYPEVLDEKQAELEMKLEQLVQDALDDA